MHGPTHPARPGPQPGPPQAQLTHTTRLHVTDDEQFGGDHALGWLREQTVLDAARPVTQLHLTGVGGGGRQVQLTVIFTLTPQGPVQVSGDARLLTLTPGQPLGERGCAAFSGQVAAGETRTFRASLRHHDSGEEYARVTVFAQHTPLHAAQPAATLDAHARALGERHTGPPTGPCEAVRGGHRRRYHHADLYTSPGTGVHEVRGDIRRRYDALGGPDNVLGFPVGDPTPDPFPALDPLPAPDHAGQWSHVQCRQHFQGGSLFLHPRTGPLFVRGELRAAWARTGWESGPLGYPTSDTLSLAPDGPPGAPESPLEFSDFQNGVLVLHAGQLCPPATATLSRDHLLAAVTGALRRALPAGLLDGVSLAGISDTTFDLSRSGNRVLTFQLTGPLRPGPHDLPEPTFEARLPVQFAASPPPDARRPVSLIARQAGLITLRAPPDRQGALPALSRALGLLLRAPVTLARVPGHAGLLSFKVHADGSLSLSFRPDPAGRAAAGAAQRRLDRLPLDGLRADDPLS